MYSSIEAPETGYRFRVRSLTTAFLVSLLAPLNGVGGFMAIAHRSVGVPSQLIFVVCLRTAREQAR